MFKKMHRKFLSLSSIFKWEENKKKSDGVIIDEKAVLEPFNCFLLDFRRN